MQYKYYKGTDDGMGNTSVFRTTKKGRVDFWWSTIWSKCKWKWCADAENRLVEISQEEADMLCENTKKKFEAVFENKI